nr:hypothetical protein L203_02563 [Cryptococcus depauperatus CBS 7841]
MATANDSSMTLVSILSATALGLSIHHAYKYDKCKCLIPQRKEWFRVLLTWMLLTSNIFLFCWGAGWCWVKYKLKWVYIPGIGSMPYPPQLYTQKYHHINVVLMIAFNIAFSLQTSLNAEEGLYWYHLMKAVQQPKFPRSWFTSSFFYIWIVTTVVSTTLQCGMGWIRKGKIDLVHQMSVVMSVDGIIELINMRISSHLEVSNLSCQRERLGSRARCESSSSFFPWQVMSYSRKVWSEDLAEANKVRTFFRALYAVCMVILGIDGLTTKKRIAHIPLLNDLIAQIIFGSFFFMLLISIVLYLPRSWVPENVRQKNIMVAGQAAQRFQQTQTISQPALINLLREGGHWQADDIPEMDQDEDAPYKLQDSGLYGSKEPLTEPIQIWQDKQETRGLRVLPALDSFTSPFAVQIHEPPIPTDLRIRVEQEVQYDAADRV